MSASESSPVALRVTKDEIGLLDALQAHNRNQAFKDRLAPLAKSAAGIVLALFGQANAQTAPRETLYFSGHQWTVKDSGLRRVGPGPNQFSSAKDSVWVDNAGELHLRIRKTATGWSSAEVFLARSLGYGRYIFEVAADVHTLDPLAVFGLFTWSDTPEQAHREIDIEFAKWGKPQEATTAQYVVQPYTAPGQLNRWGASFPSTPTRHSFEWTPAKVTFESHGPDGRYAQWELQGTAVPQPLNESLHLNLWLMDGHTPVSQTEQEVVVRSFEFQPMAHTPSR